MIVDSHDIFGIMEIEVGQNGKAVLMHSDGAVIFSPVSVAIVVILSLTFSWLLSKPVIEPDLHLESL